MIIEDEIMSINSEKSDNPAIPLSVDFNQIFEALNVTFINGKSDCLPISILNDLFQLKIKEDKYLCINQTKFNPCLIFNQLAFQCQLPEGISSTDQVFKLLTNSRVKTSDMISLLMYYLIRSGNQSLVDYFQASCQISQSRVENIRGLIIFDSLVTYFKCDTNNSVDQVDLKFNETKNLFSYLFHPNLNTVEINLRVLKNAAIMDLTKEIGIILSSDFECETFEEFQDVSIALIYKKLHYLLFDLFKRFNNKTESLHIDHNQVIIFLNSELLRNNSRINLFSLTNDQFSSWNHVLDYTSQNEHEHNIIQLMEQSQYCEALEYYQKHSIQLPNLKLQIRFLLKLISVDLDSKNNNPTEFSQINCL
jgi:hypothetical protein